MSSNKIEKNSSYGFDDSEYFKINSDTSKIKDIKTRSFKVNIRKNCISRILKYNDEINNKINQSINNESIFEETNRNTLYNNSTNRRGKKGSLTSFFMFPQQENSQSITKFNYSINFLNQSLTKESTSKQTFNYTNLKKDHFSCNSIKSMRTRSDTNCFSNHSGLKFNNFMKTPKKMILVECKSDLSQLPLLNNYSILKEKNNSESNIRKIKFKENLNLASFPKGNLTLYKLEKMSSFYKRRVLDNDLFKNFYQDKLEKKEKIVKVSPNIYQTQIKIRENINENIVRKNDEKKTKYNLYKINSQVNNIDLKKPQELVNQLYDEIRESKCLAPKNLDNRNEQRKNNKKVLFKSEIFEINNKMHLYNLAKDSNVIVTVYNQNVEKVKKILKNKLENKHK